MSAFVSRYACAFADVVASSHLDAAAIEPQLDDFLTTWESSSDLRELFANPAVPVLQKLGILDKLNAKLGLQKEVRNLMAVLIDNNRIGEVKEVIAAYRTEMQARLGIRKAEIVTARVVDEAERAKLIAGVGQLAGAQVEANFKLDASILGGAVVRIGSTVYDGSVRGRLERLKVQLTAIS